MTPFMCTVEALLGGTEEAQGPATEPSRADSIASATDAQVVIRSLAEQLVSEANVVLREHGAVISLVDECGPGELSFTLGYRDRAARVRTVVAGHTALADLVIPGRPAPQPRRLASEHEMQALVLSLLTDSPPR